MIPYTAEAYAGLMAHYGAAIWPLQLAALLLALAALWLALRPPRAVGRAASSRIVAAILAAAWLWVGVAFHGLHLASLVWAAWGFGVLFALQGLLFALAALRGTPRFAFASEPVGWLGLGFAVLAVAVHPLAGLGAGLDWPGLRPILLAPLLTPGPLTLFTFALLLLAVPRAPRHLLVIPIVWSAVAGTVAWELAMPEDLLLPLVAFLCLAVSLGMRR